MHLKPWHDCFLLRQQLPCSVLQKCFMHFPFFRQHLKREYTDASSQAVTASIISPGKVLPGNDAYRPEDKHREVLGKTESSGMSLVLSCSRRQCSWGFKTEPNGPHKMERQRRAHGKAVRAAGGRLGQERASWKPAKRIFFFPARVHLNAD